MNSQKDIMDKQREAADVQAGHMADGLTETRNSIGEATRTAKAMEGIASSLAANVSQLETAGVPRANIHHVDECTFCRGEEYHSYRREGKGAWPRQ